MPVHPRDAAVAALARDRGEALTRYAYLYTGDVAAAQDLVQDAITKVLVRSRSGADLDSLEAYVRRTVTTLFVDGHRRRRAWAERVHLLARADDSPSHDAGSSTRVDLRQALATLGRQERAAVVLRFYEDLTVPEVADRMGLAEGTVKRYLSNAMRRLEDRLGPIRAEVTETIPTTTSPGSTR